MTALIMTAQLLLGLSILVVLHEFGHYLFARIFNIRVEKFYLFFNPYFSIIRMKSINGKLQVSFFSKKPPETWNEYPEKTEWGLGWLPFGGYCAIAGMIDENKKASELSAEPQPWEFRTKPAWQRLLVMIGGVLMNLVLGCVLFIFITYHYEGNYLPNDEVAEYGIYAYKTGEQLGFETGDIIRSVNGKPIERYKDAVRVGIYFGSDVTVDRNGKQMDIVLPDTTYRVLQKGALFSIANYPTIIDSVLLHSPADRAQLQKNDKIIAIDDVSTESFAAFQDAIKNYVGKNINLQIVRQSDTLTMPLQLDTTATIGVYVHVPYQMEHYTFGQSIKYGVSDAINWLSANIKGLGNVVKGQEKASDSMSGPIGIASLYGSSWDWYHFWFITAILSLVLAFMNILPIPALDGGHVIFLLYEMVTRKKPSDKFLEYAQIAGMALLFLLMFYVIGNDIFKLFK